MGERTYSVVIGAALGMIRGMKWTVTVYGEENIPETGPAIVASNHIGYLDFVFSGYAARERGRRVRFLAKKEIFDKAGVGWLMRQMGHVPVDRDGAAKDSLVAAKTELAKGEVIGMFPEATISPSFVPRRGKTGTVRLAQETGVPLIPVAIWGTQRILTKWRPKQFRRRIPVIVNIGKPVDAPAGDDAQAITDILIERIGELLAEAQARYPVEPSSEEDRWWLPEHLGGSAPTPEDAERRLNDEREARARRREGSKKS